MVTASFDASAGRNLIAALDNADFPVSAALWLLNPEAGDWRLLIATPRALGKNLSQAYTQLHDVARKLPEFPLLLSAVSLVQPENSLIVQLRKALKTGPTDIAGIRFSHNEIDGTYIEDAYIYRLA
jgi:hypothetical protein